MAKVIVIDGIIGAGKSTLINECIVPGLRDLGWRITIVKEPVEKWVDDGLIQLFYGDPSRWGCHFQIKAFTDRVAECIKQYEDHADATDLFVLERSIFSDRLFVNLLYKSGKMTAMEYKHYNEWWSMWERVMPFKPDLFVYLKPDVSACMDRVDERSRDGESGVSEEYQRQLLEEHDSFLGQNTVNVNETLKVPCLHLFTNSNFRDDPVIKRDLVSIIEEKIKSLTIT